MSIVKAKTNPYGPGQLDIQIEQDTDFELPLTLSVGGTPIPIGAATFYAAMSTDWTPGGVLVPFACALVTDGNDGKVRISLPKEEHGVFATLPYPPKKTVDQNPFKFGGWIFDMTLSGKRRRYVFGTAYLNRLPNA